MQNENVELFVQTLLRISKWQWQSLMKPSIGPPEHKALYYLTAQAMHTHEVALSSISAASTQEYLAGNEEKTQNGNRFI